MTKLVALDTETFPIGPGDDVAPRLVCVSLCDRQTKCDGTEGTLYSREEAFPHVAALIHDNDIEITTANGSFDFSVICRAWPRLESAIWDKYERGLISDIQIREQLLNLSTHGQLTKLRLPDGNEKQILYGLAHLAEKYLSIDMHAEKDDEESVRYHFDLYDGLPAACYPSEARNYAVRDAEATWAIRHAQQLQVRGDRGYGSIATERFQALAAFALHQITRWGLDIDPVEYERVASVFRAELSIDKMAPLVEAGILRPGSPPRPHVRQAALAREILGREDLTNLTDEEVSLLTQKGIKFVAAEKPSICREKLLWRVLLTQAALRRKQHLVECADSLDSALQACLAASIRVSLTDKGFVCADAEVLAELIDHDPILECYQKRQEVTKILNTELPRMTWQGKPAKKVHFPFRVLVETGRTSSAASDFFPSANGQNIDPRARPCYVPPDGWVLLSVDYKTLELACVAQVTHDLFGASVHRDKINAGDDLHAYLGAQLRARLDPGFALRAPSKEAAYAAMMADKTQDPQAYKRWRGLAKPVGLGLPGGQGLATFMRTAKKEPYNVDIPALAEEVGFAADVDHTEPPHVVAFHGRRIFGWNEEEWEWNRITTGLALTAELKQMWLNTYPEMEEYFSFIKKHATDPENEVIGYGHNNNPISGYCYESPLGMFRAGCSYTSAANGKAMQTPAGEGGKKAIIRLVRECRDPNLDSVLLGCRVVDFIHDEFLVVAPEGPALQDQVRRISTVMEEQMQVILPDVKVSSNPVMMRRWHKEAEAVYDVAGNLIPWEPK